MRRQLLLATIGGFVLGTLGEYVFHRWMHQGRLLRRRHARHHKLVIGQGVLGEAIDYGTGALPGGAFIAAVLAVGLRLPYAALGFLLGNVLHVAFASYSHQVQHQKPHLVFWMKKPVHHLHHTRNQWRANFGISTDLWDRVFGTYEDVEWSPPRKGLQNPPSEFVAIDWGTPPKWNRAAREAWEAEVLREQKALRQARRRDARESGRRGEATRA